MLAPRSVARSLRTHLADRRRQAMYGIVHGGTDRALRQGPWKLVSAKLGRWELYNLDEDRSELNDLAAKHPERVKAMAAKWFDIAKNTERLKGRHLNPVKDTLKELNFRKDTSGQLKSSK